MKFVRTLAFTLAALAPGLALGQDAGCEVDYVVQPGDTLRSIAVTAYGDGNYQLIYSRNLGKISNPNALDAGQQIVIPCIPGNATFTPDAEALRLAMGDTAPEPAPAAEQPAPEDVVEAPAAEPEATPVEEAPAVEAEPETASVEPEAEPEPAPEPTVAATTTEPEPEPAQTTSAKPAPAATAGAATGARRIRLLTADDLPPFTGHSQRGEGMAYEIVQTALDKAGAAEGARIVFVDDRASHLQDLLIDGSFDIGFPWSKPECDDLDLLARYSEKDAWFCRNFEFSEPFFEFVNGFFVRKGEFIPGRAEFSDFAGGKICHPAGASLLGLRLRGLGDDETEYLRPKKLDACFDALQKGEVDAVVGEVFEAEDIIAGRKLDDKVEELPDLSILQTINAVAPRAKPGSVEALEVLNKGLIDLKLSGEWFRIVRRHLAM